MGKSSKICILVSNDLTHDPRVQKQAESLSNVGFNTLVLGWMTFEASRATSEAEKIKNYRVLRGIFMPHWPKRNYFLLNLKLTRFNLPISLNIFTFSFSRVILRFAKIVKKIIFHYLILIATAGNFLFRQIKILFNLLRKFVKQIKTFKNILIFQLMVFGKNILGLKNIKVKRKIYGLLKISLKSNIINSQTVLTPPIAPLSENILSVENKTAYQNPLPSKKREPPFLYSVISSFRLAISLFRFSLNYYLQMNKFLITNGEKFCPDIIHANDLDTLWAGWQIKKKTGAKLIYDAHEIWTEQGLQLPKVILKLYALMERFLFRKVDYFITVNESIAQELLRRYKIKNIPTAIIYNYPKFKKSEFRAVKVGQEIKALYQGRYSIDRGLEELVEASRYFNKNLKLYFRGTGSEEVKNKLQQMVKKFNLQNRITFYEPVAMDKLIEEARNFDIGVVAYIPKNINNLFCLPNKLFEYMMAGLAVGVADLPELSKVINKNQNGVVFEPTKPKDIAQKINLLAKDINKLNCAKQNSLIAAKNNNWSNEEKKLKVIYEKLLA